MIIPGWYEGRDKGVWNECLVNGEFHDVENLWAERFLVYPTDPNSDPQNRSSPKLRNMTSVRAKAEIYNRTCHRELYFIWRWSKDLPWKVLRDARVTWRDGFVSDNI